MVNPPMNPPPNPNDQAMAMGPPPPKKKSSGGLSSLFGGGSKKPSASSPTSEVQDVVVGLNDVSRRIRVIEERYSNIRKKTQFIEQNMIEDHKKTRTDIIASHQEVDDLKRSIKELENKMIMIIKELQLSAKKEDVELLQKYLNFWEPLNFVTNSQVDEIVNEKVREQMNQFLERLRSDGVFEHMIKQALEKGQSQGPQ